MTPRKELFLTIKQALATLPTLELVDLQRRQFANPKENFPSYFTAALIEIKSIRWGMMVEQKQEGRATVDIIFCCKDGWMNQFNGTTDEQDGLIEIDVIDSIVEKLQELRGILFKPLDLTDEEALEMEGEMMTYKISFSTSIYRLVNPKYSKQKIAFQSQIP